MLSLREFLGFLALIVLIYGVGQTEWTSDGLDRLIYSISLWWGRMTG